MVRLTPRSLILDLLRVTPDAVPVASLVELGRLFGFSESSTRVAVMRLVRASMLESDERGSYRLAQTTQPLARWIEDWRLGEKRMKKWNGAWLAVTNLRAAHRAGQRRSLRALERLGLKEALSGTWMRPDNLAVDAEGARRRLEELGLAPEAELYVARELSPALAHKLELSWPQRQLKTSHEQALKDLKHSGKKLAKMPREEAVVESFLKGGAAIRSLVRDPLLPEELMSGAERRALTEEMLAYDRRARVIWQSLVDESPRPHLVLVK